MPNFKTLQQIEPRTDLQATPAPTGVDASNPDYHFVIGQPGSYYLSKNLDVAKTNGILINAEGVTLDLMGFQIARVSGSGGNGIEIGIIGPRAAIHHGSLKGFANGIATALNVSGVGTRGCAFRDLAVSACTGNGILAGDGAVVESCRVHDSTGSSGIKAGKGSTLANCAASGNPGVTDAISADNSSSLANCTASNNTGSNGIVTNPGCSLVNCTVGGSTLSLYGISAYGSTLTNCSVTGSTANLGIFASNCSTLANCSATSNAAGYGIYALNGSSLTNCSATNNSSAQPTSAGITVNDDCTLTQCTSSSNTSSATATTTTGMGFSLGTGCTIHNCTARSNRGDGIRVVGASLVRENNSSGNGLNGDGAGIHIVGPNNRIDSNNVTLNDRGIDVDSASNVIVRNSADDNTLNYDIVPSNDVGPFSFAATATSPWANLSN